MKTGYSRQTKLALTARPRVLTQKEEEVGTNPGKLSHEVHKSKLFSTNPHFQKTSQVYKYNHKPVC